jgi:hypothetical protein
VAVVGGDGPQRLPLPIAEMVIDGVPDDRQRLVLQRRSTF